MGSLGQRPASALILALPLATGFGLLVYLISGVSLWFGLTAAAGSGAAALTVVIRRADDARRHELRRRLIVGLLAGIVATLLYDGVRLLVVKAFGVTFWPFDVFTRFGHLIVGDGASTAVAATVGTIYHYANGIGFAVAYMLVARRPRIRTGVLWALFLEACQVTLYPSWLDIKAIEEFVSVSLIGHLTYGATLGAVGARLLRPRPAGTIP